MLCDYSQCLFGVCVCGSGVRGVCGAALQGEGGGWGTAQSDCHLYDQEQHPGGHRYHLRPPDQHDGEVEMLSVKNQGSVPRCVVSHSGDSNTAAWWGRPHTSAGEMVSVTE